MKFIWEFFEELDEMVYVSDIQTNSLVYMNAYLRNSLGYHSHATYVGKKCYEVLQGKQMPCSFCTNHKLEVGKFVSWEHKNPVLHKNFLVKDTLVVYDDKQYRVEIAIDMNTEIASNTSYYYVRSETILNECLQQIFSTTDPDKSIENILYYMGKTFCCDRTYIFELEENNLISNTYEWCEKGVVPQKDMLQHERQDGIDWWIQLFQQNKVVVIENLEDIRTKYPVSYAILKPQDISTLAVGPIHMEEQILGFIGVDNPNEDMLELMAPLLNIIGYFVASLLKRRDLLRRLNNLSFHDPLTGAFNRNAMSEHHVNRLQMLSVGVIYCDITGLKHTNDTIGHDAGDQMIQHCYQLIREILCTDWIYRTGGDEFVSVHPNCSEADFQKSVQELRSRIQEDKYHIAVGYTWSNQQPLNLETLIAKADKVMYQDKRKYYTQNYMIRDRRVPIEHIEQPQIKQEEIKTPFAQFLKTIYHDVESLFQSMAQQNSSSYFYFGDMQRNLFYISDNMRQEFGFESNIVPSLIRVWAQHISTPKFKELYRKELNDMIQKKRTIHDLRYQVRNTAGKNIWVRCYAILKWNEDKSKPLFLSGRITYQDDEFVVDPVTNFPRVSEVFHGLNEIEKREKQTLVIGFSINHITEINNTRGRSYADRLLKNIADSLMNHLSDKMFFYRLEGMQCMALVDTQCQESEQELIQQIRDIIQNCYKAMSISMHRVCSFALIKYPSPTITSENFLEHIVSLIRVAKQEVNRPYVDDSATSIHRMKQMSNMAIKLSQDVLHGMEHFRVVIQPTVSAKDGRIIGGEILLRWHFEGEDISPAIFIPMLEKENVIHIVGRWVFEQAVRSCVRMMTYIPNFCLAFNVSAYQLADEAFTDIMQKTLQKYRLQGKHLIVEMTESCLDEQPETLTYFMDMCKKMGIQIALDDFGSGYSSLRMLLRYPCDVIKIDHSLLLEVTKSEEKLQFIRSIVYACHQFGKMVCMEGVENAEQNIMIKNTGCDMIQGYHYYHPMELSAFYRLLSKM